MQPLNMAIAPQNPAEFTHSDLAAFFDELATATTEDHKKRMLQQGATHFAHLAQDPPRPITPVQKEELLRLAKHPLLTRPEKTKLLLDYVRYEEHEAADRIRDLQSALSLREDMKAAA
jgi:hypothetical protein